MTSVRRHPLFLLLAVVAGFVVARVALALGWGGVGVSAGSLLLIAGMIGAFAIVDARRPAARSHQR